MDKWLKPAFASLPDRLDRQTRQSHQPGCILAIAHDGRAPWPRKAPVRHANPGIKNH